MTRPAVNDWGSSAAYVIALIVLGGLLGLALTSRAMFTSIVDWNAPTDMLVGLGIGGLLGLLFALTTMKRYGPRRRIRIAAVALLVAALTLAFLHGLQWRAVPLAELRAWIAPAAA